MAHATGVPIGGFLPFVGIGLTNEFDDDLNTFVVPSSFPGGTMLGQGDTPFYDVALLDTGAAVSLLTAQAHVDFNINGPYPGEPDGFRGTQTIDIGGATGILTADINDPLGLYVGGLQGRTATAPLTLSHSSLEGQTNTSLITLPAESDLPNVVGLTYASQYATHIRSDMPQIFELNGRTVRTPQIEFNPLGSGGQGITRRAPMSLNPGQSFLSPPFWFYNLDEFDLDNPHENPSTPTVIQGGLFLNVNVANEGEELNNFQFFFDTGADVTVVSELNAVRLGFDPAIDTPDFTVAVVGSGGTNFDVPGFFADEFTIQAVGGSLTFNNVPIIVLDVASPANPGNVVDGIVGTNLLAGRNVVIDPNPSAGGGGVGPSLYISDPITTEKNWTSTAASGAWGTGSNWSGGTAPDNLGIANVRHVSGGNQTVVLAATTTAWEVNVSGTTSQTMTVEVQNGVKLTAFSGINIEQGGVVELEGGTLDAQFVEIVGGALAGEGLITTGSGPIPGQVENRDGIVAVGDGTGDNIGKLEIIGRFANAVHGIMQFDLGGLVAGTQHDQLVVEGSVAIDGALEVSLVDIGGGMFSPIAGNAFTLITATDGLSGTFDSLSLPVGFQWNIAYNTSSVVLSVLGPGLTGDYNGNGVVDAADYTVWRNSFGTIGAGLAADGDGSGTIDEGDYVVWKDHFGETLAPGAAGGAAAVPEPASLVMFLIAASAIPRARFAASKKRGSSCSS